MLPDPISTYTSTFRKIAEQVNVKANDPVDVPSLGLSAEHYRDKKLLSIVKKEFPDRLVVVIDEIDKHDEINEILYTLSRGKSKGDVNVPVVTISISNDIEFKGAIDSRAQSTLQPKHWTFTPYEDDQLVSVLDNRREAFYQEALRDDVISEVTEPAADEHGDARRAVRLLRNAGEVADKEGCEIVTADHVSETDELVELESFIEMVKRTPLSGKLLLFALTRLDRNNSEKE